MGFLIRCGYDFEIRDTKHLFDTPNNYKVQMKKRICYFEVKGSAGRSNGEFHISANEVTKKENTQKNKEQEAYVKERGERRETKR